MEVVLVCDRYSAYKSFAKGWRSDFSLLLGACAARFSEGGAQLARTRGLDVELGATISGPFTGSMRARLEVWDAMVPLDQQPAAFVERHDELKSHLGEMQERCEVHLKEPNLHGAKRKVLSSLHNHWDGLTVFVERPEVAMDNNTAERALRTPVVGRKNYYGSGRCGAPIWPR